MRAFELHVVLVKTIYESNIGATSRAMSNMGAKKLFLISKQCEITFKAQQAAASGQDAFQNRTEYDSWNDFYKNEPDGIRIAFSARDGRGRSAWDLDRVLNWIKTEEPRMQKTAETPLPIYLIFGPEDWGLSNEDIDHAHFVATIPTYGDNWSLNLAQATLIALYTIRQNWGGIRTLLDGQKIDGNKPSSPIEKKNPVLIDDTLKTWLLEMGFDLSKKKINVYTVLKRLLLHNVPTTKELRILEIVLQQSTRKLKELKELKENFKK